MKILIADEMSSTRDLIVESLTDPDMQVVCATEGVQAWQLLSASDPPRVAILDWVLLDMNGLDICRKMRSRASPLYTYVILIGARSAKADMLAAFEAGADEYITKPIDGHELLCRVRTGLRMLEKEEKLSRIIRGWRTMLDSLPFGVACLGHGGQLLRANIVFVEMLGFKVEAILGKSLKQSVVTDPRHFSTLMTNIRMRKAFDRVEMEMTHGDGSTRAVIVWGRPIPDTKEMVYQIIISLP